MKIRITFSLCICLMLSACREAEVLYLSDIQADADYLSNWTGSYEGVSDHWSSYPTQTDSGWIFLNNHDSLPVFVAVQQGTLDSCLTLTITYNQTTVVTDENLKISILGSHSSNWGGGSSYGSLSVNFSNDSLHYNYHQGCGIPCTSGINFKIRRN